MALNDYDALLVLSFGGPEGEDEVIPFLENVTRGRGIPRERLAQVGEHYFHFGGVSPINRQNRELIANIEAELARRGIELPVYFGNRNWRPFAEDAAKQLLDDGHRNVLVFATSAWGGYSACRQYDEDIQQIREVTPEITYTKLWQFYGHPTFVELVAEGLRAAVERATGDTRVLFTAHSVPTAADENSGGPEDRHLYSRQVAEAAELVAKQAGVDSYEVVWQSRSGNPATPWLEPDVVDRAQELQREGMEHLICVPIGFITDHMEVVWDLDTELKQACEEMGVSLTRTPTVGLEPAFAGMVVDIAEAVGSEVKPKTLSSVTVQGCTVNGAPCKEGCCAPVKRPGR
ncbi:ferrochelatase [Corynebacterium sp. ACRQP]|uniref:ferrochelatase n=1 Tax=Corynebacterium sp. ACRQP TaxID=2918195 RepID=UPI001EF48C2D|nr:ferrochelatase [Corynebacterium sp. ACRQP]MCG7237228.1 ferrochelatase [Corynebacterium sp. ACRQP]